MNPSVGVVLAIYLTLLSGLIRLMYPYDLFSPVNSTVGASMTLLSYSGGAQLCAGVIIGLLANAFYRRPNNQVFLEHVIKFGCLLVLAFVAKGLLKNITQIPRPFTEVLTSLDLIDSPAAFYRLSDQLKGQVITMASTIDSWRTMNWLDGLNYSFPSGHTIFVSVTVFYWASKSLSDKCWLMTILLICWGTGVAMSRLYLGMHRPEDLYLSVTIAFAIVIFIECFSSRVSSVARWLSMKILKQ